MNALYLTLFVSAVLVIGWLVGFALAVRRRDHDHADRLSLLPLADDDDASVTPVPEATRPGARR